MLFKPGEGTKGDLSCEILRPIYKGGMAELYLGGLKNTGHKVVIKAAGVREQSCRALQKEAEILSILRHQGIPELLSFVKEESRWYYIMAYYEGMTLEQYIGKCREMTEKQVAEMVKNLCGIMVYLHDRDIIHNDIKPSNILVQKSGGMILLDYGLAGYTSEPCGGWAFRGTLGYAAPECWQSYSRNPNPGPYTDIFALGATMYYLLDRKEPRYSFGKYQLSEEDTNKKNRWQPVLDQCTARHPFNRYRSAAQVYEDISKWDF